MTKPKKRKSPVPVLTGQLTKPYTPPKQPRKRPVAGGVRG